jgi:hypothetical protein
MRQYSMLDIFFNTNWFPSFPVEVCIPPPAFVSPHYRVELYTTPDPETSLSQHDILKRISKLPHSNVYYACGMIFDAMDLYESNLDKLRLVDVCQSPDYGLDNDRHFIYFKDPEDSNPIWRSEPFAGRAFSARDFSPTVLRPEEMISYISEVNEQLELLKIEQKEKLRELRNNTAVERRKLEKQLNKNLLLLEERHNRLKKNLEGLNILKQHLMEKALEWKSLNNLVNKERHLRAQYLNTVRILNRHKKRLFETALMHTSKELVDGAAFSIEIPPSWRIASLEKKYNEPSESDQK